MLQCTGLELLTIILNGGKKHQNSQRELYKRYYSYGMSIASLYVDSKEEAITILNDSFLKVFDNLNKFDTTKPFKPWFRRILTNTAINLAKSNRRYARKIKLEVTENYPNRPTSESQISYEELIAAVHHLSTAYRDVFNLYVIDGYKHQ